jgi:hypothetical protein
LSLRPTLDSSDEIRVLKPEFTGEEDWTRG